MLCAGYHNDNNCIEIMIVTLTVQLITLTVQLLVDIFICVDNVCLKNYRFVQL